MKVLLHEGLAIIEYELLGNPPERIDLTNPYASNDCRRHTPDGITIPRPDTIYHRSDRKADGMLVYYREEKKEDVNE